MAENGYGTAPVAGHVGRIPNFGKTQVNPMGCVEPPACIQNAMMTKDKKPFTYTPGGLDLSQIKTPSMARRLARQRSLEEQEQQAYGQQHPNGGGNYHHQGGASYHPQGGPVPPPPPPPPSQIPAPPPPPPIIIEVPNSKSAKPIAPGERPEIIIPDNPIGMLRKTNSPYHWEAEKAELNRIGPVPKFVEKVPSPLTVKMPPSTFSQQPPQSYIPQNQNTQRQNYPYSNQTPESPVHKPEAQYANQKYSPMSTSPVTREILQRQDSQFNKSPAPFTGQSPVSNGSSFSPSPNSSWRQPERRESPANNIQSNNSQSSSPYSRGQFSPNTQQYSPNTQQYSPNTQQYSPNTQSSPGLVYHTLPRAGSRPQDNFENNQNNNAIYNNTQNRPQSPRVDNSNTTPWRTNTLSRPQRDSENVPTIYHNSQPPNQQPSYVPPYKAQEVNNNQTDSGTSPPWKQEINNLRNQVGNQSQQYSPPWATNDANSNKSQERQYSPPWRSQENKPAPASPKFQPQDQPRYQSSMSIPITPRKPKTEVDEKSTPTQKEVVYVNQEPVYYCPDSPKSIPPWVRTQKEKTKTPPPAWCQRPLEGRKSLPRELATPPRDSNQEPEWVRKSNELQSNAREVTSPPKYQQTAQPSWSTIPSENRRSVPKETQSPQSGSRVIPIQMEVSTTETRDQGRQGGHPQPHLRISIGIQPNPQGPLSQPTQRIMRVLSPQLVKLDDGPSQHELPTLNRSFQGSQDSQPRTRIIPIQIEGGNGNGANNSVYYHKFSQEGPPRQSKAFRVLQVITGTQEDSYDMQNIESQHGFSDL